MIDFRSYKSIESAIMIKWVVPNFATAHLTDYVTSLSDGTNTYQNIGNLLSVTGATSELKSSPSSITISLSGIPTNSISDILSQEIKGSQIYVYRAFFNAETKAILDVDPSAAVSNVLLKFKGIVTNYDISDSVDVEAKVAISTITLTCSSMVEVLTKKVSGRRTNPADFPGDAAMNRVQALANSNFNFGAP